MLAAQLAEMAINGMPAEFASCFRSLMTVDECMNNHFCSNNSDWTVEY